MPRALLIGLAVLGCSGLTGPGPAPPGAAPPEDAPEQRIAPREGAAHNFLIIVGDDLGDDKISAYEESPSAPRTPNIDGLAAEGVLFRNAYTYPTCSASRAALLTGRYGRRNGMGGIVELDESSWELPLAEVTIPEALGARWHSAAIGKWHLSGFKTPSGFRHPMLQGFERVRGSIGNLPFTTSGRRGDYFAFEKNVDGRPVWTTKYATVDTTDDAIEALHQLQEPFFLWVAYNASHVPLHWPPPSLVPGRRRAGADPRVAMHDAMTEALDAEIGRLLAALTPEQRASTTIVFVGDNGTDGDVVEPPFDPKHAKATLYEGGTNVPLIVAGAGVAGHGVEAAALVHAVDLLPTVLDLAGVPPSGRPIDGISFAPVLADPSSEGGRRFVYTERFVPIGAGPYDVDMVAVRDRRYKLLHTKQGELQLFDLAGRFDDGPAINVQKGSPDAEQKREFDLLKGEMDRIGSTVKFEY